MHGFVNRLQGIFLFFLKKFFGIKKRRKNAIRRGEFNGNSARDFEHEKKVRR